LTIGQEPVLSEVIEHFLRPGKAEQLIGDRAILGMPRDLGELAHTHAADLHAGCLVLVLQTLREGEIRLVSDHGKSCNTAAGHTLNSNNRLGVQMSESSTYQLSPLNFSTHLSEVAALRDVRVDPACARGGGTKDEPN